MNMFITFGRRVCEKITVRAGKKGTGGTESDNMGFRAKRNTQTRVNFGVLQMFLNTLNNKKRPHALLVLNGKEGGLADLLWSLRKLSLVLHFLTGSTKENQKTEYFLSQISFL